MTSHPKHSSESAPFDLQEQLEYYLGYWKWFVLCIFLALIGAYTYLRYSTPIYRASTTILVKDDKKGGLDSELSAFSEIGLIKGVKSNVSNEIEILKSRTLAERTVSRMGLNVTYVFEGLIKSGQAYNSAPIQLIVVDSSTFVATRAFNFTVKSAGTAAFDLYAAEVKLGRFRYSDTIATDAGLISFQKTAYPNPKYKDPSKEFEFQININPLEAVAQSYRSRLTVKTVNDDVNVVELAITDPVQERAVDYLDMLVNSYIEDAIADKNLISQKTSQFINDRLELITNELDGVERDFEGYKKTNRITDIPTETGLFLANASDYEKMVIEVETQLRVVGDMLAFMRRSAPEDVLPSNISSDANATELIAQYNKLVLDRNRIIRGSTPQNPVVVNLDLRLASLRESIEESLLQLQNSLQIRRRNLTAQERKIGGALSKVPTQEREFKIIDRQQKIKESLYLYLLQKREETAISLAVTAPNAKIVDKGYAAKSPISPKRNIIFLVALFLGAFIPFGSLYLRQLLDTKVKSRTDVEGKTSVPFLGDIPKSQSNTEIISFNSRSSAAEAIRIVRTNLEFLLTHVPEG
ncbi:MAG: Wzz/FepE/Etk N-terminal domain-containing protein, partial [Flavobacterium sp.]|nr:Wzz/FepE/Etk N-terminal domain-containing protein [Flavobacterium sp.]